MKKGFTLIELLVVVLIIGILAAIAVPQYTKAVEKSRTAEAYSILRSVYNAQQVYNMQHGGVAGALSFEDLDIDLAGTTSNNGREVTTKNFKYTISGMNEHNQWFYNLANRLPLSTKYAIMSGDTKWFCCWFAADYEKYCVAQGFTVEDVPGWMSGSIGCKNKSM